MLQRHFKDFAAFFFPRIHEEIDWSHKPDFLLQEAQELFPRQRRGKSVADEIVRVRRRDGSRAWVYVHVEIEASARKDFPRRMFLYSIRIFERHREPVVSLAVFTGKGRAPAGRFEIGLGDSGTVFFFPVRDLKDFEPRRADLEREHNPFAMVVLAHLERNDARGEGDLKLTKIRLIRKLHERRHGRRYIMDLLRFLDWLLRLPPQEEEEVARETEDLGEAKRMPYITSWEQIAMEKGVDNGREEGLARGLLEAIESGLELRFGAEGRKLLPRARKVKDIARLRRVHDALFKAEGIQDVKRLLPRR
jgi:hypothetical protein